jgi:hypothetical protein
MRELELPEFTRRIFLSRGLQALGAAAVLPLAADELLAAEDATAAMPALAVLAPGEYAVLSAVADTMIPHGGAFELGARDVDLARRIDGALPRLHPDVVTGVRGALAFVEQQAPGLAKKERAFTSLGEADRAAVFSSMVAAGGLPAAAFLALKFLCCSYFYSLDATWKYTGYDGPMLLEGRK